MKNYAIKIVNMLNDAVNSAKSEMLRGGSDQYSLHGVPAQLSVLDNAFNKTIIEYKQLSEHDKDEVQKLITIKIADLLLGFGERFATYSLRLSSQEYFTNGLIALSVTLKVQDTRELLRVLSLYCDVQKKRNLSFSEVLEQGNEFSSFLKQFINREKKDKTIECMRYVIKYDDDTPTYYDTFTIPPPRKQAFIKPGESIPDASAVVGGLGEISLEELTPKARKIIDNYFADDEKEQALSLLVDECIDELQSERLWFAALRVSDGDLDKLRIAIRLAKRDWRDLLVAAGFAENANAHKIWAVGLV